MWAKVKFVICCVVIERTTSAIFKHVTVHVILLTGFVTWMVKVNFSSIFWVSFLL